MVDQVMFERLNFAHIKRLSMLTEKSTHKLSDLIQQVTVDVYVNFRTLN
jgi:hypothetical protein